MSLMNVADWAPGQSMPSRFDFAAQEQGQYDIEFAPAGGASPIQTTMDFVEFGRPWIDLASGGSATWTKGVNFARLLYTSSYAPEIISLYHRAGLNLNRDLDQLTRNANITADPAAVRSLEQTSVPTGRLQVPELDMHTISDQLVPVQQENYYRNTVAFAGRSQLLRQAFVQRQRHCNFEPSELVARRARGAASRRHGAVGIGRHAAGARGERHQPRGRRPEPWRTGDHPVPARSAVRRQRAIRPVHGRLVHVPAPPLVNHLT